ncbi:transporter [Campylobacter concisus]|uniref:transporter n=1 Tax=Campylobacter concisus TaxID=199 RepID=UPI001883EA1E|nr:transporter [Campylobacter concisus]MBE9852697.1 transporter [Campylobacter concisus]
MLRIKNEYLVVVAMGLLCTFMGSVIVSLIAVNFVVALICALFCMKKDYIFILLLALNFALYFNAIDTPFEQPELWTYHVPALANATYGLSVLVYASAFLGFLPLVVCIYFLYSLCVVLFDLRKILRAKFEL